MSLPSNFPVPSLPGTARFWWGCDCHCDCYCDGGKQSQLLVFWTWTKTGVWQLENWRYQKYRPYLLVWAKCRCCHWGVQAEQWCLRSFLQEEVGKIWEVFLLPSSVQTSASAGLSYLYLWDPLPPPTHPILPNTLQYYWILPNIAGYCWILQDTTEYCLILPNTGQYCQILPDTSWYCLRLPDTTGYCPILGFSLFFMVFNGFSWVF